MIPSADPGDLAAAFTAMYRPPKGPPTTIDDAKADTKATGRDAIDTAKSAVRSAATGGAGKALGEVKALDPKALLNGGWEARIEKQPAMTPWPA